MHVARHAFETLAASSIMQNYYIKLHTSDVPRIMLKIAILSLYLFLWQFGIGTVFLALSVYTYIHIYIKTQITFLFQSKHLSMHLLHTKNCSSLARNYEVWRFRRTGRYLKVLECKLMIFICANISRIWLFLCEIYELPFHAERFRTAVDFFQQIRPHNFRFFYWSRCHTTV